MTLRYPRLTAALLALLPLGGGATAGGFQTLPPSASALGMAGAVTATSRDASCAWFNPGALGMLDSANVSIGFTGQNLRRIFRSGTTTQTTLTEQALVPGPYLYAALPVTIRVGRRRARAMEAKLATAEDPTLRQRYDQVLADSTRQIVFALAANSPYGFQTKWPTNWQGRALVQESRVQTLFVQPTAAYRFSERFSLGAGLILAGATYDLERGVGEFADASARYSASGVGAGWQVGIKGRAGDEVAFGIAYRSAVKIKMTDGEAAFQGIPASQAFRFPSSAGFSTRLNLPWQLTAGISNRVTDKLLVNFTFELSGWSAFDSLNIVYANNARPTERGGRRYQDAMAFRVGAEYQYTPALALRTGIYYDESPVRDQNITADLPDANVLGACAGVGYQLGRHLRLDAAYTFGSSARRNSVAKPEDLVAPAISGQFRHLLHGGSVGIGYQF